MTTDALIEAVLFAAAKPMAPKRLVEACLLSPEDVAAGLDALAARLDGGSGIMLQRGVNGEAELVTRPDAAEAVANVVRSDVQGELSRAALEALTVLAYRGPLTRPELEQIRGVQSSLILRNLLLRGLIEQREDKRLGLATFAVSGDFLKHLGLARIEDLPDYDALHAHATVSELIAELSPSDSSSASPVSEPSL